MQNAPEGPGSFPFPVSEDAPPPRVEGTPNPEAEQKAGVDVPAAAGRRVSVVEQFVRNRPDSRGAKFLGIMDRIGALFKNPHQQQSHSNITVQRGMSLYALLGAILGRRPEDVAVERLTGSPVDSNAVPLFPVSESQQPATSVETQGNQVLPNLPASEVTRRFSVLASELTAMNMMGRQVTTQPPNQMTVDIIRAGFTYRFTYQPNGSIQVSETRTLPPDGRRTATRQLEPMRHWDARQFARVVDPSQN